MYRKIDPRIWNDRRFNSLSFFGKFLFIYFLTHPNLTMLGMLRFKREFIPIELDSKPFGERLGIPFGERFNEPFVEGFDELLREGLIDYDEAGLITLKNFIKYNPPDNPNVVKSWKLQRDLVPECSLFWLHCLRLKGYFFTRGEAFVKAFNEVFPELAKVQSDQIDDKIAELSKSGAPSLSDGVIIPSGDTVPETVRQTVTQTVTDTVPETVRQTVCQTNNKNNNNNNSNIKLLEGTPPQTPTTTPKIEKSVVKKKPFTHHFELEELPKEWKDYCEQVRPELDSEIVFTSFKFYYKSGNGNNKVRSDKGWNQSWQNWVKSERNELTLKPEYKSSNNGKTTQFKPSSKIQTVGVTPSGNAIQVDPRTGIRLSGFDDPSYYDE